MLLNSTDYAIDNICLEHYAKTKEGHGDKVLATYTWPAAKELPGLSSFQTFQGALEKLVELEGELEIPNGIVKLAYVQYRPVEKSTSSVTKPKKKLKISLKTFKKLTDKKKFTLETNII